MCIRDRASIDKLVADQTDSFNKLKSKISEINASLANKPDVEDETTGSADGTEALKQEIERLKRKNEELAEHNYNLEHDNKMLKNDKRTVEREAQDLKLRNNQLNNRIRELEEEDEEWEDVDEDENKNKKKETLDKSIQDKTRTYKLDSSLRPFSGRGDVKNFIYVADVAIEMANVPPDKQLK